MPTEVTKVTKGIKISVNTEYKKELSAPEKDCHWFAYHICIENHNDYTVRLLRRHWHIFDSLGERVEIEGQGVIGQQPQIEPGKRYEYESACDLVSDIGEMYGVYLMERKVDGVSFEVEIPAFQLVAPYRLN